MTDRVMAFILGAVLLTIPLVGEPPTNDEGLFVRRIVELWKSEDYDLAKKQMRQFLQEYPKSPFRDRLMLVAGDQEYRGEHYVEALEFYGQIESEEYKKQTFDRFVDSLFRAKEYPRLLEALKGHLPPPQQRNFTPIETVHLYQYAEALADAQRHQEAIAIYERLFDGALSHQAKLGAAISYAAIDQPEKAAALYLALGEALPDQQEPFLLRAAQLQSGYDPNLAAGTLSQLQGDATAAGVFSQVFLLFQGQRYQELWDRREALSRSVPADQSDLLKFFLGRTAFALGRFQDTIDLLQPLLSEGSLATESNANERTILALLVVSAQKVGQLDQAQKWMDIFAQKYPSDETLQRLWLSQGEILRAEGKLPESLALMKQVADKGHASEEKERACFQQIGIQYDLGQWRECHQVAEDFVATFPSSCYRIPVSKAMVQATGKQLENMALSKEERAVLQDRLATEITALTKAPRVLTATERPVYLLQLAKAEYARGNFLGARAAAYEFINDFPRDKQLYQAHLILAYSYCDDESDLQAFIRHAETALRLRPDFPDSDNVRLNLFAVYLQLAKEADEEKEDSHNISKAANHLSAVVEGGKINVKYDSLLWLARYYYLQVRDGQDSLVIEPIASSKKRDLAERAVKLIHSASDASPNHIDRLEDGVMLSQLYGWLGLVPQRQEIMETFLSHQWPDTPQNNAQLNHLRLALAETYETMGERDKAIKEYGVLLVGKDVDSATRDYSQLQIARLRYSKVSPEQRVSDNDEIVQILGQLQTLQARRNPSNEPVHLEAAWERAHILADIAGVDKRSSTLLTNLKQAKRSIVADDDIVSKDYHATRQDNPNLDRLYQAYLMLFDAKIAQLEAEEAGKRKLISEQRTKEQAARMLYSTLLEGNFAVSKYLVAQAQSGLDEMKTVN